MKKFLSFLLTILMLLSIIPFGIFAVAETSTEAFVFEKENMLYDDFDTAEKRLTQGFGLCTDVTKGTYDKSVFVVTLDGNKVLKPNGADGTNKTMIGNLRYKNCTAKFTEIVLDIRIDTPLVSGTKTALYFDHIGAGKESAGGSTPQQKLNASYVAAGTDDKGTYIFTGPDDTNRYYITLGEWTRVVINMPGENNGTCKGYVKPSDSDNYVYIGSHSKVKCYGSETYQQQAFYFLPVSGFDYYIDNLIISESGEHSKVRVLGYQQSAVQNDKYSLRFVVGVEGIFENQEVVGFDIECPEQDKAWIGVNTSSVYKTLYASFGETTVNADDYDCVYLAGVVINNIPTSAGEITLTVKPYTIINGQKYYSNTAKVTIVP